MSSVPQDFPQPRPNRAGPASGLSGGAGGGGGAGAAVIVPQVALYSFLLNVSGITRSIGVSRFFRGPAVIDSMGLNYDSGSNTTGPIFAIYVSDDDTGERANSATVTDPTGTPIFEGPDYFASGGSALDNDGLQLFGAVPSRQWRFLKLGVPVQRERFTVKVSLRGGTAAVQNNLGGWIRVVEAVAPSDLLGFL